MLAFVSDVGTHHEIFRSQAAAGVPFVALGMPGAGEVPVDLVMPDFAPGLAEAAAVLHADGHRRFAMLDARSRGQRAGRRPAIFEENVRSLKGATLETLHCGPAIEQARQAMAPVLARPDRPTAVVALNDLTAIGVMRAAIDAALMVPGDLSVVGIDGVPMAAHLPVSLSTIAQPHAGMVGQAVGLTLPSPTPADQQPQAAEKVSRTVPGSGTP